MIGGVGDICTYTRVWAIALVEKRLVVKTYIGLCGKMKIKLLKHKHRFPCSLRKPFTIHQSGDVFTAQILAAYIFTYDGAADRTECIYYSISHAETGEYWVISHKRSARYPFRIHCTKPSYDLAKKFIQQMTEVSSGARPYVDKIYIKEEKL